MEDKGCHIVVNKSNTAVNEGCLELLTAAKTLGEVGGIFQLAFSFNQTKDTQPFIDQIKTTQSLDDVSRKICPKLTYFAVFTSVSISKGIMSNELVGNSTIEHIINKRVANGLSGKALQWNLADSGAKLIVNIAFYINSLDLLLSTTENPIVSAFVVNKTVHLIQKSPVELIAKELDVKDVKSLSLSMTIGQLELNPIKLMKVKYALEKAFRIYLSPVDLQNISIDNLKELCEESNKIKYNLIEIERSDKTILQRLCLVEKQPVPLSNELIPLNNVANGVPVIVFSGIFGQKTKIWQLLGNAFTNPAYIYQYDSDENVQSIQDTVLAAFEKIRDFLEKKNMKTFNIIAYSIGAAFAHDIIIMLEKAGFEGKVIFIDSSKLLASEVMYDLTKTYSSPQLSKNMLEIIMHELVPNVTLQAIELYMKFKYTNQIMIMATRDFLLEHNFKNPNALVLYIASVLIRLQTLYDLPRSMTFEPLQSEVMLIKASQPLLSDIDDCYGLEALATRKVNLEMIDGDHRTILQNEILPNIINKYFK